MIEEGTLKELLEDRYRQYRNKADSLRERGEGAEAAQYYRKCAKVLIEISEKDSNEQVKTQRRELAENLSHVAERLENHTQTDEADSNVDNTSADESPSGRNGESNTGSNTPAEEYLSESPELDFNDVGGMSDLKQTLHDKVTDPLERSELYEAYDVTVVNGILLHGPPGTGKTYISEALAGELGYSFIDVTPADITSSLVGEASANVEALFDVARTNQPCLVFVDEIDAIAAQRSGGAQKTQSERQMVNQLLEEMSAIQGEDIIVVGATNLVEEVDDAVRRSGRFDERIKVPPPDRAARKAILRIHLRDKPVLTEDIDWEVVADQTNGFVASDMELIATEAAFEAISEVGDDGEIQPITQVHINRAINSIEVSNR